MSSMNDALDTNVSALIESARQKGSSQMGRLLELYRNYLAILAATQISDKLRIRVSPSDIVQETMLAACRDFGRFRGTTEREFLAWLRKVLIHTIHRAVEVHLRAKRRDARREVSLDQLGGQLDRSAAIFVQSVVDGGPSPSAAARQREASVALADQLAKLPAHYRDVIVMRNLQGFSFEEIAVRMNRSSGAIRMLWLRAIDKFKRVYDQTESGSQDD
jgi:RNA polymerase sigma-70 factor (ECF subfamily)